LYCAKRVGFYHAVLKLIKNITLPAYSNGLCKRMKPSLNSDNSVCPLVNENGVETWRPACRDTPAVLMLAVKYAATPFTKLNYSIPELVRASVDLVVTA
jgi:hypothetical protein